MKSNKSNSKKLFPIQKNTSSSLNNNLNNHFMRRFKSQDLYSFSPQRKSDNNQKKQLVAKKKNTNCSQTLSLKTPNIELNPLACSHNLSSSNSKSIMTSPKKTKDKINFNLLNSQNKQREPIKSNNQLSNRPHSNFVLPTNILNDESIQELDTEENINSLEDDKHYSKGGNAKLNFIESKRYNNTTKNQPNSNKIKIIDEQYVINSPNSKSKRKNVMEDHSSLGGITHHKKIHISVEDINTTEHHNFKQLNKPNDIIMNEFLQMSRKGDKESFLNLFETIINIDQELINNQDDQGMSALHYASDEGNFKIVEILIRGNAEVNVKSKTNKTPLHLSSHRGYFDISKLLIENGAIINCQDNERNTPIHYCVMSQHIELLKYFLDKYPQADIKNIYNKTPYDLSKNNEEIQGILTEYLKKLESKYHKVRIHNAKKHQTLTMFSNSNTYLGSPHLKPTKQNDYTPNKSNGFQTKGVGFNNISTSKKKTNNNTNIANSKIRNNNVTISTNIVNVGNNERDRARCNLFGKETDSKGNNHLMNSGKTSSKGIHISSKKNFQKNLTSPGKNINQFLKNKANTKGQFDIGNYPNNNKKKKPMPIITSPSNDKRYLNRRPCEIKVANVEINLNDHITENNINNHHSSLEGCKDPNYIKEQFDDDTVSNNQSTNQNNSVSIEDERITPSMFIIKGLLGKGSFGEVYLVEKKNSIALFAMKVLNKDFVMGQNIVKYAMTERNILSLTSHPFIVKLNYAFQTSDQLFLILEYCPGGDLSKHLAIEKRFTEERAKIYLCEIVLALGDLHKRDIIFRDLKPDNVVLDKDGHALLTDFGLSKEGVFDGKNTKSFCGSVAYLAPEMLKRKGHGKGVDWYLLGVLFYEMLVGIPPYFTNDKDQIFNNIEKGELQIPKFVSEEAKQLLEDLLNRNIMERLGSKNDVNEIKEHNYFKDINWDDVYERKLNPPKPKLDTFVQNFSKPRVFPQEDDYTFKEDLAIQNSSQTHFDGWSFIQKDTINTSNNDNFKYTTPALNITRTEEPNIIPK